MVILSNANRIKWLLSVALKSFIGSPLYPQAQIQTLRCGPNGPFHMGPGSIHVYLYTFIHIFPLPEIILCLPPFLITKFTCSISRWAQAEGESLVVKSISMLLVLMLHVGVLKPWWDSGTARGLGANYSAFLNLNVFCKRRIILQGTTRIKWVHISKVLSSVTAI